MSFPSINSPNGDSRPDARSKGSKRGILGAGFLMLIMFVAVFGPCTAVQAPREVGRWKLAQAIRLREEGDKEAAYQRLEEAIAWFPRSADFQLTKAEWLLEDEKREEAIQAIDKMLAVGGESYAMLVVHAQFLQNAGEFERAVEDWKQIALRSEVSGEPPRAQALNGLAYAQSLAIIELEDALKNVNEALASEPGNAAYLDTRGYIYYRMAQAASGEEATELLDKALADLDPAVKSMDRMLSEMRSGEAPLPKAVKRARDTQSKTLREMADSYETRERGSAVMHYHRALILEALGRQKEADAERGVARRLIGKEPDDTLF